ncbi:CG2650 [Drosophila busckii]|uniref:CG2650 n=1 Tax=Drosophila busckii TaxID=30019 RepID=A0A0M3QZS7_DROBS|nr:circadian clock-controlled protein [Drosophila busckii]ALC49899.1 CG2650 [Drosophila busckii]
MLQFTKLAVVVVSVSALVVADIWPSPLKRCQLNDAACYEAQAQSFLRVFKHGMPALDMPSIEPLQLGTLRINSGGHSSSLQFNLLLTNATMHNFGNSVTIKSIKGFSKDLSKPLKLTFLVNSPSLEVRANYDVDGKILILPIVSKGDLVINLHQVVGKTRILAQPEQRDDGHTYLKINDLKTIAKVGSGHFNMTNLFDDNVELRESTLKVLNDEWQALLIDVQPKVLEACDRVFKVVLQKLWHEIPYDQFFENE